jgi:hypothetical protein
VGDGHRRKMARRSLVVSFAGVWRRGCRRPPSLVLTPTMSRTGFFSESALD